MGSAARLGLAVLSGWLAAAGSVAAQVTEGPLQAELRRCRAIAAPADRVACYDAIDVPGAPARGTVTPSARGHAPLPVASVASASRTLPSSSASSGAAAADSSFGLPERPAVAPPQAIESSIPGDFAGWTPGTRLRLANEQVWEIVDGSTAVYRLHSPKVRVSRGLLGSYFLEIEGVAQTPRVKRVQ